MCVYCFAIEDIYSLYVLIDGQVEPEQTSVSGARSEKYIFSDILPANFELGFW